MHPLQGIAMALERDLYSYDLHYQGLEVMDDEEPYIQVLCRDEEEQDHLIHILMARRYVLCFD